jgi:uncharacterized protein
LRKSDEDAAERGPTLIADCADFMLAGIATMESLHPAVVDITPQGLVIAREVTAEEVGLNETDERLMGPLSVNLEVRQQESAVTVAGTVEGTAVRQCVRCLADYEDPLFLTLYADYLRQVEIASQPGASSRLAERKSKARGQDPMEEDADEQDELYHYQGDHIDLTPMLREQIILAAPMQPLCREDCAGLCSRCGQNLNDRRCACEPEAIKSPFRILRERHERGGRDGGDQ